VRKARKPLAILLAVAMMLCMAPAAVFGASDNSADVERIAEHDRYMTAAKIAETAFPDGAKTVVIANGEDTLDYADALAGSFLAGVVKAPILLTRTDTLPKATKDVIRGKLGATEAYILGGTAAVSEAVVSELKDDLKLKVTRVAGVNRFETAAKILEVGAKLGAEVPDTALIANGTRPADGLVASAYAYKENIPVLLVLQNNIPPETKKALKGIKNTYVIGGEFVVSDDILNALPNATRLSGDTRFHTSVAVAKQLWKSPGNFALVQGIDGLVDALAGAVLGVPILYVAPDQPDPQAVEPQVVADYLDSAITENSSGFVLGGRISANVVNAVQQKIEQKKEQKKPIADLKVVEVTAVDANTIKVIFEGVDEPVTIKLDEALVHGKNEVTFEYEGVEYTVTVDYVDPEYKNPDEDDPIDTGLITAIKGAQDAIKSLPALSDLDLGAKKDVETARAKVEQAKKLGATNIDIGLDLIDILEKAEAKIALLEAKTTLQMKINEATEFNEADYTAASWQALQAALANARSAAADENASQTQIDQALDDLNAAISALVEKHIWQTVTIAWSDNIAGLFTSMDTDSFGRPHISYYDATDGDLMYVWQDDSGWHSETVDSEGNTGKFTSLAVDANGIPHISYYDLTNGKIKHAIRNNSTWEKTEVDEVCTGVDGGYYTGVSTSIAIDNSNRPHISYYDYNQQCLKHAWLEGSVWEREIVEAPIITSSDGASWKTQNSGTNKGLLGIAWGDSKFVAVDMSGKVYTSPDGTVWSVQDSGTKKYLQKVTWNGSQFAAVGASGTILTSPDGINWTTRSTGTTKWIFGIGWGGGKYVAVGDVNTILTSADGVDWITQSSSDMESLNGVTWGKDRFVAVGDQGTIITSTDGFAWSPQNSGTVKGLSRVIWGKDQFVAIGDQGTLLTSPDGSNWTAQDSGTINHLKGITWSGSQYVAVGILGTILTSPDGISWTAQQSGARWGLYGITWGKDKFVAVGDLGTVLTSPDGITWTPQTLTAMAKASYYDVAWNGSKFVAGGRPERIITSADGISWTFQIPGTTEGLYGVACSSGQFAAVGYPGTILTSPDGISWADHFTNTSNQLNDIAWGNDKIVAVGIFRTILTSEAPPALEVVSTDPVSDATDIPVGKTINVTFNGNVTADFSKISVSYSNSGGEQATAECSYSVNGNVISIEPKLPLQHNTTYKVHIPCGAVQNQSGKPLASDYSFSFKTGDGVDNAGFNCAGLSYRVCQQCFQGVFYRIAHHSDSAEDGELGISFHRASQVGPNAEDIIFHVKDGISEDGCSYSVRQTIVADDGEVYRIAVQILGNFDTGFNAVNTAVA
jgi:putative cell wall-binding protein/methionine-rich copper-binding protein CopC